MQKTLLITRIQLVPLKAKKKLIFLRMEKLYKSKQKDHNK
jgi:hypothetical protein